MDKNRKMFTSLHHSSKNDKLVRMCRLTSQVFHSLNDQIKKRTIENVQKDDHKTKVIMNSLNRIFSNTSLNMRKKLKKWSKISKLIALEHQINSESKKFML